jgi:hypothetical protein
MFFNPITILSLIWIRGAILKLPVKAGFFKVEHGSYIQKLADTIGVESFEGSIDSYTDGTWQIVKSKESKWRYHFHSLVFLSILKPENQSPLYYQSL